MKLYQIVYKGGLPGGIQYLGYIYMDKEKAYEEARCFNSRGCRQREWKTADVIEIDTEKEGS
jgi:hypothetical protein